MIEQTLRDQRDAARRVREHRVGRPPRESDLFLPISEEILPFTVGVPSYPDHAIEADEQWSGRGVLVPFTAYYRYEGRERYLDRDVHRISATYTLRWPPSIDSDIPLPTSPSFARGTRRCF